MLGLDFYHESTSNMCANVSEKPRKGVGFFFGQEHSKMFPYRLMVIPSSLYTILASKRCRSNRYFQKGGKPVFLDPDYIMFK